MPHVIVKLWPGKSEKQKTKLAEEITKAVVTTLNYGEEAVSVAMEEIGAKIGPRRSTSRTSWASPSRFTKSRATRRLEGR